jgi:hypothetical protein
MKRAALLRHSNPLGLEGLNCNESTPHFTACNSTKRSAREDVFLRRKLNKDQFFILSVAGAPACLCLPGAQRLPQQALSPKRGGNKIALDYGITYFEQHKKLWQVSEVIATQ